MIGIFDSGIGGLTVVRELLGQHPDAGFVYLGDTARVPYGNKTPETIIRYALEDAAFLVSRGVTSIVIACNTASAVAADAIRAAYPHLPVFDVIEPAVREAQVISDHVGVIGTRATIASEAYQRKLAELGVRKVMAKACPLFVPLVEEGWFDDPETKRIARRYLAPFRQAQVGALILGCTHYPLLAPVIQRAVGKRTVLVDSPQALLNAFRARLGDPVSGEQSFFVTDASSHTDNIATSWLGRPVRFDRADVS